MAWPNLAPGLFAYAADPAATASNTANAPSSTSAHTAVTTTSPNTTTAAHAATHAAKHVVGSHSTTTGLATSGSSTTSLFVHEIGALLVVVGLIWVAAKVIKNRAGLTPANRPAPGKISVLSRQTLAKGVSVAIVHVGGKDLLVGITPSGISLLSEIDLGLGMDAELQDELGEFVSSASVESDAPGMRKSTFGTAKLDGQWTADRLGGASPLQAWMAKLDGLREMTIRRS